jgi:Zn-dependent peptidase ImmA (M78 family)
LGLRRDANGVPVLDEFEIESLGERFLAHVAPDVLASPTFTPLAEVLTTLQSLGHLTCDFLTPLGYSPEGYRFLGCYRRDLKRIFIDRDLADTDPRFPFTVAHELGHFYLHSQVRPAALGLDPDGAIVDSARDLVVHRVDSSRPRSIIEWQANRFAASILVPRATLSKAVEDIQRAIGITHNIGIVWYDPQPQSRRDYQNIVLRLSALYRVSRSVIRYRLAELRISREFTPRGVPRRVGDLLSEALNELFKE